MLDLSDPGDPVAEELSAVRTSQDVLLHVQVLVSCRNSCVSHQYFDLTCLITHTSLKHSDVEKRQGIKTKTSLSLFDSTPRVEGSQKRSFARQIVDLPKLEPRFCRMLRQDVLDRSYFRNQGLFAHLAEGGHGIHDGIVNVDQFVAKRQVPSNRSLITR